MLKDIMRKYWLDLVIIGVLSAVSLAAAVLFHGALKPSTRLVATVAPITFTACGLTFLVVLTLAPKPAAARRVKRALLDLGFGTVFIAGAFLRAESFYAPIAFIEHADAATVAARIAADDDWSRFRAWSRLLTLKQDQKTEVAEALGRMLDGADAKARHSATMTLEIAMPRLTLPALISLAPELRAYLAAGGGPNAPGAHAAEFARRFVQNNVGTVRMALEPKNRGALPEHGFEALFLALATENDWGRPVLKQLAALGKDQDPLSPVAADVLKLL